MAQQIRVPRLKWASLTALGAYLGVCSKTLYRWIAAGKLRAAQTPLPPLDRDGLPRSVNSHGGAYRVLEEDIRAFLRQYRKGGHDVPLPESLWR